MSNLIYLFQRLDRSLAAVGKFGSGRKSARARWRSATYGLAMVLLCCSCSGQAGSNDESPLRAVTTAEPELQQALARTDGRSLDERKQALTALRISFASVLVKQKAAYVLGRILMKGNADEVRQAASLFEESAAVPSLWEPSQWHLSECGNTLGNEKLVRKALTGLLSRLSDPESRARAQYALAQSFLRANEPDKAREHLILAQKEAPDSSYALGANYYLGQASRQAGDQSTALTLWRDYLKRCPDGRFAQEIVQLVKDAGAVQSDHSLFARVKYAHGDWQSALSEWDEAKDSAAWFERGQCLLRLSRTKDGKAVLLAGLQLHPNDAPVPEAARTLSRLSDKDGAIGVWKLVLSKTTTFQDAALYNLAIRAAEPQSLTYYAALANRFPDSDYASESRWWLVWDKIKKGVNAQALQEARAGASRYQAARAGPRFSFWVGKLLERAKQKDAAIAAYKQTAQIHGHHYYGWRARARISALSGKGDRGFATNSAGHVKLYTQLGLDKKEWTWPLPPQLLTYVSIAQQCGPTVALLTQLHQWDECLDLLKKDQCPELRSACLAKLNLPLDAINAMATELKGPPDRSPRWQLGYPLLYSNIVVNEARAKKVDPLLAQALTREESRYNVHALSSSNAHGLMQLLPGTAYGVAKRLGVPLRGTSDIHKPEINIKLGVDYMAYTMARCKGNAMLAVASYNGGPNAVSAWTKRFSLSDPDLFVESIPYSETRDYVRKVFGSYWNYEAVYRQ